MKHIVVFGANGRVGSLVVEKLLANGYRVTGFVHQMRQEPSHENLTYVEGDIHDAVAVESVMQGTDAVVSALGSWGTPTKDILRTGMQSIIPGMKTHGLKRIITLTGSEARARGDELTMIHRFAHIAAGIVARKILDDGEGHIALLESSGCDWTTIRSPIMIEKGSREYRLGMQRPMPWATIHRHAVVTAVVAMLEDKSYVGKTPFINR